MHDRAERKFEILVLNTLELLLRRTEQMAIDLTALTGEVTAGVAATESAVSLIHGIADKISAAVVAADADTQAKVDALTAQLKTATDALAAAVAAHA